MMGPRKLESQAGNKTNAVADSTSPNNRTGTIQFNNPQVDVHTLEENIVSKVRRKWIT